MIEIGARILCGGTNFTRRSRMFHLKALHYMAGDTDGLGVGLRRVCFAVGARTGRSARMQRQCALAWLVRLRLTVRYPRGDAEIWEMGLGWDCGGCVSRLGAIESPAVPATSPTESGPAAQPAAFPRPEKKAHKNRPARRGLVHSGVSSISRPRLSLPPTAAPWETEEIFRFLRR